MINLMLGQPGGGKSYESVAFHVIPAIEQGRKVITNLPLRLDIWESYFPGSSKLIDIRSPRQAEGRTLPPFSRLSDYGDPWRKPGTELGPLYIIDECHKSLPRQGTPLDVEEWFAEHRHEGADVLLITQSYGKINAAIRDAVQLVYRCKKATAFGSNDKYIRKVQDGIRGEVVNTSIRAYESKYFPLYKSHTKTDGAVQEAYAQDVTPIWRRWPFMGAGLCAVLVLALSGFQLTKDEDKQPPVVRHSIPQATPASTPEPLPVAEPRGPSEKLHPYQGYGLHLAALVTAVRVRDGQPEPYLNGYVTISQEGQPLTKVSFNELRAAGYSIKLHGQRVISLTFKDVDVGYVVDDLPRIGLASKVPESVGGGEG